MTSEPADRLIADEYLLLQKRVEEFDARLLTIKAWSVTFAAAAIGLAWQQGNRRLLLVSAISAFAFWVVEAVVKTHQRAHYPRLEEIEAHFSGIRATVPMQIFRSWSHASDAPGKSGRFLTHAFYANVCLPHVVVMLTALGLYVTDPPAARPAPRVELRLN